MPISNKFAPICNNQAVDGSPTVVYETRFAI